MKCTLDKYTSDNEFQSVNPVRQKTKMITTKPGFKNFQLDNLQVLAELEASEISEDISSVDCRYICPLFKTSLKEKFIHILLIRYDTSKI